MKKLLAAIAAVYRKAADHLTKIIGAAGVGLIEASQWIDPDSVMGAALKFLHDDHVLKRIGEVLFALVIARGFYTGMQVKKLKAAAAPPPGSPQ